MNKVPIFVSLAAAAAAVGLSHLYFQRLEAEVSGGAPVSVLVVTEDLPAGGLITDAVLATRNVPSAYVERRQVRATDLNKVLGARVAAGIQGNETLSWDDLAQSGDRARVLSGLVENGLRAIAIDGKSVDFDGLLRPGDRVDVLFTRKDGDTGSTVTLLQNLLVLSVGGDLGKKPGTSDDANKGYSRGSGVVLDVTEEQAQLIVEAEQHGALSLTLRNSEDIAVVQGIPATAGKDVELAKDRTDWRHAPSASTNANAKTSIDHVR